jgi:hypothetical protein
MLQRLPKWELSSYQHQVNLDKIRERLASAGDLQEELRRLSAVTGFSEFAMSLMWMAEKAEHDSQKYDSTPEEDELVFSLYRKAVGEGIAPTLPPTFEFSLPAEDSPIPSPVVAPAANTSDAPPTPNDSIWGDLASFENTTPAQPSPVPVPPSQGRNFSALLDQTLEAVQSGAEDRLKVMDTLVAECKNIVADTNTPEDCRSFCQPLLEFLEYVLAGELIDDIRVMNIISNIQGPFAQWEQADPGNRAGLLDGAIDILRDFKTMFE